MNSRLYFRESNYRKRYNIEKIGGTAKYCTVIVQCAIWDVRKTNAKELTLLSVSFLCVLLYLNEIL